MLIYQIKNEKLNFFNRPIFVESANEALSYIQNILMSDADRALLGLKEDLALYENGSIDFVSGVITPPRKPRKVCDLKDIFDSIPKDRVPQTAHALHSLISDLSLRVKSIENFVYVKDSDSVTAASLDTASPSIPSEVVVDHAAQITL